MDINKFLSLINKGEGEKIEFKEKTTSSLGKDICAMANTNGGIIFIGVSDNREIKGVNEDEKSRIENILINIKPLLNLKINSIKIDNKLIFYIKIPKSKNLHSYGNIVYVRIGSVNRPLEVEEILQKGNESLLVPFDRATCDCSREEIDKKTVERFLELREKIRGIKKPQKNIYEALEIVIDEKITNGGFLFFSRNPQKKFPQAKIRILQVLDEKKMLIGDEIIIDGNLWSQVSNTLNVLKKYIIKRSYVEGFYRKEAYDIDERLLREGVLNAVIHRNYLYPGDIRIFVFKNKIKIINPGGFPPGVTPKKPKHFPRNPLIARYFFEIGLVDKYGSGISMMKHIAKQLGILEPVYEDTSIETRLVIYSTPIHIRKEIKDLDDLSRNILKLLFSPKSSSELAKELGVSQDTILRRLKKLQKKGFIKAIGEGKSRKYSAK